MAYVLVLGAGSDIGKAVVNQYAKNGYDIYLAGRNPAKLELEAKELSQKYRIKAKACKFDVLEFYNHKNFYSSLNPRPVGVICLTGYSANQYTAENDFLAAKKVIDISFTGCVSILNIIANDFEARKEGFIVGVSSVAGDRGRRSNYIYGAARAGFTAYLSGLRSRLLHSEVKVITVKLGYVKTGSTLNHELPALITATPEEVAYDLFKAQQKGRDVIYTKWQWRFIAMYINNIPEMFFKKMET